MRAHEISKWKINKHSDVCLTQSIQVTTITYEGFLQVCAFNFCFQCHTVYQQIIIDLAMESIFFSIKYIGISIKNDVYIGKHQNWNCSHKNWLSKKWLKERDNDVQYVSGTFWNWCYTQCKALKLQLKYAERLFIVSMCNVNITYKYTLKLLERGPVTEHFWSLCFITTHSKHFLTSILLIFISGNVKKEKKKKKIAVCT